MNKPKILVAIPYHSTKNYCLEQTFKALNSLTYLNKEIILRADPLEYGSKNAVKLQREFFRRLALDKGFDYLYFLGCDTIPPRGVLEKLLAHDKAIVGGVYWGRHNAENGSPDSAVAWIHSLSQKEQSEAFLAENELLEVDGMGMDCVLIRRDVLEKISFISWEQNDDDYPFYDKAKELGYKVFLDTGIQCKHYFSPIGYAYRAKALAD